MIITVASGKGGTGKTTVAVGLAQALAKESPHTSLLFLDCDVEEPNAHLFLHPSIERQEEVGILIPEVDFDKCTYCGRCAEVCVYHAIAVVGQKALLFPELCHGCGSCTWNCPEGAIHEVLNPTGIIEEGRAGDIRFAHGVLHVGEAMATPVIRHLKRRFLPTQGVAILDAPPGTACPVVETLRGADFALMVTEPTPFGLHDLRLAVQVSRDELGIPVGVVVNRDGVGDDRVDAYCQEEGIPILMRIPLDRRVAEAYSEGKSILEAVPEYQPQFVHLYRRIQRMVERRGP
ncbi:MAG: ATP-binding protein [Anaerolineae bacterium]|nr:ATP-binding protein [Anaerolineae bacterium]